MNVLVKMAVCPRAYLKNNVYIFRTTKFWIHIARAVARSSSGDIEISHVLPVVWVTEQEQSLMSTIALFHLFNHAM